MLCTHLHTLCNYSLLRSKWIETLVSRVFISSQTKVDFEIEFIDKNCIMQHRQENPYFKQGVKSDGNKFYLYLRKETVKINLKAFSESGTKRCTGGDTELHMK